MDQIGGGLVKLSARKLSRKIEQYHARYPANEIHVIGLSAGTGVAVWGVEQIDDGTKVENVVLLGSSLAHDFDATPVIENMNGRLFVYHAEADGFLPPLRLLGTIDGQRGKDAAGQVGLDVPEHLYGRIVNIGWSPEWDELGWDGGHLTQASREFVCDEVARRLIGLPSLVAQEDDEKFERARLLSAPNEPSDSMFQESIERR